MRDLFLRKSSQEEVIDFEEGGRDQELFVGLIGFQKCERDFGCQAENFDGRFGSSRQRHSRFSEDPPLL